MIKIYKVRNILSHSYISILIFVFTLLCGSLKSTASVPTVKPIVVEITGKVGSKLNSKSLAGICKQSGIPASSVFEWNNHLVIFGDLPDTVKLKKLISAKYPACNIKVYAHPFYNFNRKYCSSSATAKEWDNTILTCNMVNNLKMQREYLAYHATQFQKWPEVSNGFCHANFQQLLVFRNGRQLMLIISIPKGESLDKLNPKTTENNPRVDDWNNMMKKYQEGIPGTQKGEVWVFFKGIEKS
jgi:hypothetical protein